MSDTTTRPVDAVNPAHYRDDGRDAFHDAQEGEECIDYIIRTTSVVVAAAFCECNAIKYLWRAGKKESTKADEDRAKAKWYSAMRDHLLWPDFPDPRVAP